MWYLHACRSFALVQQADTKKVRVMLLFTIYHIRCKQLSAPHFFQPYAANGLQNKSAGLKIGSFIVFETSSAIFS